MTTSAGCRIGGADPRSRSPTSPVLQRETDPRRRRCRALVAGVRARSHLSVVADRRPACVRGVGRGARVSAPASGALAARGSGLPARPRSARRSLGRHGPRRRPFSRRPFVRARSRPFSAADRCSNGSTRRGPKPARSRSRNGSARARRRGGARGRRRSTIAIAARLSRGRGRARVGVARGRTGRARDVGGFAAGKFSGCAAGRPPRRGGGVHNRRRSRG